MKNWLKECTARINSEEGQAVINDSGTHVVLIWEDGEITSTKSGDLFGHRSLHQSLEPWCPPHDLLFEVPESPENPFSREHEARVITDRKALNEHIKDELEYVDPKPRGFHRL